MLRRSRTIPFLRSLRNTFTSCCQPRIWETPRVFPSMLPKFPSVVLQEWFEAPPTSSPRGLQLEGAPAESPAALGTSSGDAESCAPRSGSDSGRVSHNCPAARGRKVWQRCLSCSGQRGGRGTEPTPGSFEPSAIASSLPLSPKADWTGAKLLLVWVSFRWDRHHPSPSPVGSWCCA